MKQTKFLITYVQYLLQPVLHDWCNKGCGMYYPLCGMVDIKDPLLLKAHVVVAAGFLSCFLSGP